MEKSKMAYLILKNLYNGNTLTHRELGLNKKDYTEILDLMQKRNLISGVRVTNLDQEKLLTNNQRIEITIAGVNYLMENSVPDHEYKIQTSIDEINNGIELNTIVDINGIKHSYKKVFSKPLTDIDAAIEAFDLASEGLKREKESRKHAV